ncbi:MAG TPA: DUF4192 domain-containing protein [Propionibacteriaceae bacterium]
MTNSKKKRVRKRPSASPPARVRASSPADLLALVPYLLGFRPEESLVVVLIRSGQVLLTARIDLPPVSSHREVTGQMADLATQHSADAMVVFAYSEGAEPAKSLLSELIDGLTACGLIDALYVDGHRWWSLMCTASCCPPEGTPFDPSTSQLAAEAVFAGLGAAPARSSIEAQVRGPNATDLHRLSALGLDAERAHASLTQEQRVQLMSARVASFLAMPGPLGDDACAELAVLAVDVTVRDVAWAAMSRPDIDDHLDLWGQVVARAVAPWEAAPLCLLGMAAWISGNGALQNCCADRARRVHPGYSMTTLLDEINQRALPPSFWDLMAADMRGVAGVLAG